MKAGDLRHRITLQSPVLAQNPTTGTITESWESAGEVYANIAPLSAREFIAAQAVQSKVSTRITIRYRAGVTAAMRVVYGDRTYRIEGVLPDVKSGREWLTLPCSDIA